MALYETLKAVWKKLRINGQVKNFSFKELWTLETDSGKAIARRLRPGFKTPPTVDCDAFRRTDNISMEGHSQWWKLYDISTVEVLDQGTDLQVSAVTKTAVDENHFGPVDYRDEAWGSPIQVIIDVKHNQQKQVTQYLVTQLGWISPDEALKLTCHHEIDNARPVFPKGGDPYIRTRRDLELPNNISEKGIV